MKYTIVGGGGFIGKALSKRVIGTVIEEGDIIPKESDILVNLAAIAGIDHCERSPSQAFEVNTALTFKLLNTDFNRFIFASSAAAIQPKTIYGATKLAAEVFCLSKTAKKGVAVLRISNVYGPGSKEKDSVIARWCKSALSQGVIEVHGDGRQLRDFIYIDDVVDKIVRISKDSSTGVYPVSTGRQYSVIDVAKMIKDRTGADIIHIEGSDIQLRSAHNQGGSYTVDIGDGLDKTLEYFKNEI